VLEVLATLKRAGAERVAVELARGLDRTRLETAVVSLFDPFPGGLEPIIEEAGIRTWHLHKRKGFDPRMWPRLARVLREFRPDIIHTHSYILRYAAPVAGPAAIVHTVHNLAGNEVDALGRWVNRLAFRRGASPVAVGKQIAASFRRVYGFDVAATIPNGIDLTRAVPSARHAWRAAHSFGEDDVLVVSVGRLDPQKDPLGLIQAFARGLELPLPSTAGRRGRSRRGHESVRGALRRFRPGAFPRCVRRCAGPARSRGPVRACIAMGGQSAGGDGSHGGAPAGDCHGRGGDSGTGRYGRVRHSGSAWGHGETGGRPRFACE
jgi:hypothetical protein